MEDLELYNWATEALSEITDNVNDNYYKELNGNLTLQLETTGVVNAGAIMYSDRDEPPRHAISITYKLIRTLYDDATNFVTYIHSDKDHQAYALWFKGQTNFKKLKENWGRVDLAKNIFLAGLTWVYFHELGHLTQGHQYIRDQYSSTMPIISEIHSSELVSENSSASTIWHATEIAADYFAACFCVTEIIRQFGGTSDNDKPIEDIEDIELAVCFLTCGISLMLHRFQGANFYEVQTEPVGTHPKPFHRLEIIVPLIHEILSSPNTDARRRFVLACGESTYRVGMFWIRATKIMDGIPEHYLVEGLLNRPGFIDYIKHIIVAWDNISLEISERFTFGTKRMLLNFGDTVRTVAGLKDEITKH